MSELSKTAATRRLLGGGATTSDDPTRPKFGLSPVTQPSYETAGYQKATGEDLFGLFSAKEHDLVAAAASTPPAPAASSSSPAYASTVTRTSTTAAGATTSTSTGVPPTAAAAGAAATASSASAPPSTTTTSIDPLAIEAELAALKQSFLRGDMNAFGRDSREVFALMDDIQREQEALVSDHIRRELTARSAWTVNTEGSTATTTTSTTAAHDESNADTTTPADNSTSPSGASSTTAPPASATAPKEENPFSHFEEDERMLRSLMDKLGGVRDKITDLHEKRFTHKTL